MKKGKLVVISGPMYGRKSLALIEEIKNWEYRKMSYMAFSPVREEIFSRGSDRKIKAEQIHPEHPGVISYMVGVAISRGETIQAVAIDEVSFYDQGIVDTIMILLEEGIDVIVSGLDKDFRGRPFKHIGDLMALALEVRKLYTICMKCQDDVATTTQRLLEDGVTPAPYYGELIAVEGEASYKYEARCSSCYERG